MSAIVAPPFAYTFVESIFSMNSLAHTIEKDDDLCRRFDFSKVFCFLVLVVVVLCFFPNLHFVCII